MRNFRKWLIAGAAVMAAASIPHPAMAQINSNAPIVTLNATLPESLTVAVTGGATVNFTLAANTAANAGSTTSTVKTSWVLSPGRTTVSVWAWVPVTAQAMADAGTDYIPASAISATATGSGSAGGALNSVTSGSAGVPAFITPSTATGVQIGSVGITGANKQSSTTTTLTWNINTAVIPQLPAASYTGTVNIQAQATP